MHSDSLFRLLTAGSLVDVDLWSSFSTLLGSNVFFSQTLSSGTRCRLNGKNWLAETGLQRTSKPRFPLPYLLMKRFTTLSHAFRPMYLSFKKWFKIHLSISGYNALSIFRFRDITSTQTIHIKTGQMRLRRDWGRPEREICQTLFFSWRQLSCRILKTQR